MAPVKRTDREEGLKMKLVVLGSNGYRSNDLGQTACYAIPELGLTLDAGTGLYRMFDYLEDDGFDIYLSHDHRDHTRGLTWVWQIFWKKATLEAIAGRGPKDEGSTFNALREAGPKVRVHLAPEHMPNVQSLLETYRDRTLIEYVPLTPTQELTGGTRISSFPVDHLKDQLCLGFRVDTPGGSLAYITDTYGEPGVRYAQAIRGVDVLLHECCVSDDQGEFARKVGHSHITPVAQLAAEAQVGRLVLIHLSSFRPELDEPELDRAYPIFPRTEVSYDRMEIEF
jgi:ribonuclease BN (tRNA processing enzyme)